MLNPVLDEKENPYFKLMSREWEYGGILALLQGKPGSGKTSLLLYLSQKEVTGTKKKLYEHDILIWRGMYSAQFQRFPEQDKVRLFFLEDDYDNFLVYDLRTEKEVDLEDYYKVIIAEDIRDLYNKLKKSKGFFNVVYLYTDDWYELFDYLVYWRPDLRWLTLMFDEFRDIAPAYPNSLEFMYLLQLDPIMREIRKNNISIFVGIHNNTDIYYTIKEKFQINIYLAGAKRPKYATVYQKTINSLRPGQAIIEDKNRFVWIEFPKITYRTWLKLVNPEWKKREKERKEQYLKRKIEREISPSP